MPICEMDGAGFRYTSNEIMFIESFTGRREKRLQHKGDDQRIVTNWSATFLHIHANLVNNIISLRATFGGEHERRGTFLQVF